MKTTTVRLTNVTLEPKQGKKGTFYILALEAGDQKFGQIQFDTDVVASVGDLVNIAYEETTTESNGKKYTNNKIHKVEVLEAGTPEIGNEAPVSTSTTKRVEAQKVTQKGTTATILPSKDISMEVSGILQALIQTGQYNRSVKKTTIDGGVTDRTYLDSKLLDNHLRRALNIKRTVSAELEATGSLSLPDMSNKTETV